MAALKEEMKKAAKDFEDMRAEESSARSSCSRKMRPLTRFSNRLELAYGNGCKGRVLKANNALYDMMGYSANDLVGRTFRDITYRDDIIASSEAYENLENGMT